MGYIWHSGKFKGIRFREHPTRKHGIMPDRYFAIRYQLDGKRREEALGWASEGWTEQKAALELEKLRASAKVGDGPCSLREKRQENEAKRQAEAEAEARKRREALTLRQFFDKTYYPAQRTEADTGQKSPQSVRREEELFRLYIAPAIGDKCLKDIAAFDLERLKKRMHDKKCAPRSIAYCLAVVRQIFNMARRLGRYTGDNPVGKIKKPKVDKRRLRFLSHEEADRLLDALALKSPNVHDMALLSLHCGLRAGEIFGLEWGYVDMERGVITIRGTSIKADTRTKSGKTRPAIMTDAVKAMLAQRVHGQHNDYVFPDRTGKKAVQVSESFNRVVTALGFNQGVEDGRQKVVFHTLRHTFASWLVEQGIDLYTVKELMGHGTLAMTERYSHLDPEKLQRAVKTLEEGIRAKQGNGENVVALRSS